MSSKENRSISVTDTILLVTNAGGRCSFNYEGQYCNKVLSDGRVNLGERAHIIGVNGPRANEPIECDKNAYENLIWLCRDHHKIIDHTSNLNRYTVNVLREMKARHEARISTGSYPYYGSDQTTHDYSVLSCLFEFIDIHTLYSCAASYPSIHLDFFDVSEMCFHFREGNPDALPLKDPILRRAFINFEHSHYCLENTLRLFNTVSEDMYTHIYTWPRTRHGESLAYRYLLAVERLIDLVERRFPQILHQEVYNPFPEIDM
ncbi:hypothetical protein [Neptuniibacter sp. QD48_11]|uniref:hypothetical protein n=1 Tax=Neptuniibacter sp. QD48_11 TaxID=3398211 RepID=UPI0039F448D2